MRLSRGATRRTAACAQATQLRLYLENLLDYKRDKHELSVQEGGGLAADDEPPPLFLDLFPLTMRDALEFRAHPRKQEPPLTTAANRVPVALEYAVNTLMLPGEYKEGPFLDTCVHTALTRRVRPAQARHVAC